MKTSNIQGAINQTDINYQCPDNLFITGLGLDIKTGQLPH